MPANCRVTLFGLDCTMSKDRPTIDMPPAEKKRLSYLKDCRPSYGNNVKAARKAVPRRKAIENRNDRHATRHALAVLPDRDDNAADLIQSSLTHDVYRMGGWTKGSDVPLGEVVKNQKMSRIERSVARQDDASSKPPGKSFGKPA